MGLVNKQHLRKKKMEENLYKILDRNENTWEIGLRDIHGKGKLSGYIKVNTNEFIIANFNTKKSAKVWWDTFKSMLNKGEN